VASNTLLVLVKKSYPSKPDRQVEHVSMANKLLGIFLFLILSACSAPPKAPTTDESTVRQDRGEVKKPAGTTEAHIATTPPEPRCTKQLKQGFALRERIDNEYWQREGMEPFEIEAMNSRRDGGKKRDNGPTRQEPFFFKSVGRQQKVASKMQKHLSAW